MGFTMPEEDENLFVSTISSTYSCVSFCKRPSKLRFVDTMPKRTQQRLRIFYKTSTTRTTHDPSKTLLVKNVFNTGLN